MPASRRRVCSRVTLLFLLLGLLAYLPGLVLFVRFVVPSPDELGLQVLLGPYLLISLLFVVGPIVLRRNWMNGYVAACRLMLVLLLLTGGLLWASICRGTLDAVLRPPVAYAGESARCPDAFSTRSHDPRAHPIQPMEHVIPAVDMETVNATNGTRHNLTLFDVIDFATALTLDPNDELPPAIILACRNGAVAANSMADVLHEVEQLRVRNSRLTHRLCPKPSAYFPR